MADGTTGAASPDGNGRPALGSVGAWLLRRTKAVPRLNWDLCLLTLLLVALNVPRLRAAYVPRHDTLSAFQVFHLAYSNLFFNGRLPEWMPYGVFGMTIDFLRLNFFSPATYLMMGLGALAGVRDALLLFKLSLLLEQLFLLLGTYLLARELYQRALGRWLVCVGAICTADWTYQLHWNFRIYYLLPLGLYFLVRFFKRRRGHFFWLAGVTFLTSLVGTVPYHAIIYLFLLLVFCSVLLLGDRSALRPVFERSAANAVSFLAFALLAAGYVCACRESLDHVEVVADGRDLTSGAVGLKTFLTYGGHPQVGDFLRQLAVGWPVQGEWSGQPDASVYVGLLPLFLCGWALARERSRYFLALAAGTAALLWLSLGGGFAAAAYFLPGMHLVRHLGLLYPLIKLLLLFCAGFGVDDFLRGGRQRHLWLFALLVLVVADAFGALDAARRLLRRVGAGPREPILPDLFLFRAAVYVAGVAALAPLAFLARRRAPANAGRPVLHPLAPAVLLLGYLFDVGTFNAAAYRNLAPAPRGLVEGLTTVQRPEYLARRQPAPDTERARKGLELMRWACGANKGSLYEYTCDFLHFSPRCSEMYTHMRIDGVRPLLLAGEQRSACNRMVPNLYPGPAPTAETTAEDEPFQRVVGCAAPRLRLVPGAVVVATPEQALEQVRRIQAIDGVAVLRGVSGGPGLPPTGGATQAGAGEARVVSYTPDEIEVVADVAAPGGAWLVFASSYHPDWEAMVDGVRVPLAEAYRAFPAVGLSPGSHRVTFCFRRHGAHPGQWLAPFGVLAGLALCAGYAVLLRAKSSGPPEAAAAGR
jgi:hypothetical protein